jgi:hypothetical protein
MGSTKNYACDLIMETSSFDTTLLEAYSSDVPKYYFVKLAARCGLIRYLPIGVFA